MKLTREWFKGRKIGFFGIGKSNSALMRALPLEECEIVLRSDKTIARDSLQEELRNCKIYQGALSCKDITEDVLFLSPSVRRQRQELLDAAARGVILSSDAELFFENNSVSLYSITGSDGKSTTASLIHALLSKKNEVGLIGNIGTPMYSALSRNCAAYVCELSSFMLSHFVPKTERACITNLTPNHLNYHKTFEEYISVKLSLLDSADESVISYDDPILREYSKKSNIFGITSTEHSYRELKERCSAKAFVTYENENILLNGDKILSEKTILRSEPHNIKNLMMAIATTYGKVCENDIKNVAATFSGLPHRCELIGSFAGVDFYDSSIDSSPARTAQTLKSLGRRTVVILGGRGKGVSFIPLREALSKYCHHAVIYGECAEEIYSDIKGACPAVTVYDFDDAVEFSAELGRDCGTVILSPAATSYDAFSNYEERGERFRQIIKTTEKQRKCT